MAVSQVRLSSYRVPDEIPLVRDIPRRPEHRTNGYLDKYDFKYLFFDLYRIDGGIEFNGPPMFNFKEVLGQAPFAVGNTALSPDYLTFWKVQRTTIKVEGLGNRVVMDGPLGQFDLEVQDSQLAQFEGRRVLFTLSKNNDLVWIKDWALYYSRAHGIDAILFYDNGSDRYDLEQIADVLSTVPGLKEVRVISWPFPYGPRGGPGIKWDSDFTQYCMIEHARRRFFARAASVTYADVDELVVCEDGKSLHDHLKASSKSAITYQGVWVETVSDVPVTEKRFWNYQYNDFRRAACTRKWTIVPSAVPESSQIHVHAFGGGFEADFVPTIRHRHFKGINFDWKNQRTQEIKLTRPFHSRDEAWVKAARKIFSEEARGSAIMRELELSTGHRLDAAAAMATMADMEQLHEKRKINSMPWLRKEPLSDRQLIWQAVLAKRAGATFGEEVFVSEDADIFTTSLKIGKSSWIAAHSLVRGQVAIGSNSTINVGVQIAGSVVIGNEVRIGAGSTIMGFNHGTSELHKPIWRQKTFSRGIIIGHDVWIGANVSIVDGVTIGDHSIVGAGAIVTKSMPPYSRILGTPAQKIDDRRALLNSEQKIESRNDRIGLRGTRLWRLLLRLWPRRHLRRQRR